MKQLIKITLLFALLAAANLGYAQKKIKEGSVKFEISMPEGADASPEMAMMAGTTLDIYFSKTTYRSDVNLMGGMMKMKVIAPNSSPKDAVMLMNMMGKKIQITGMDEDMLAQTNSFMNFGGAQDVTYDKNDKKKIAGYDCHLAKLKMPGGMDAKMYVTEKIKPPTSAVSAQGLKSLKGYPLEMTIDIGMGMSFTFKATEVKKGVEKGDFNVPEGYEKMTMEEFQEQMGGMMGFGK